MHEGEDQRTEANDQEVHPGTGWRNTWNPYKTRDEAHDKALALKRAYPEAKVKVTEFVTSKVIDKGWMDDAAE